MAGWGPPRYEGHADRRWCGCVCCSRRQIQLRKRPDVHVPLRGRRGHVRPRQRRTPVTFPFDGQGARRCPHAVRLDLAGNRVFFSFSTPPLSLISVADPPQNYRGREGLSCGEKRLCSLIEIAYVDF